LNFPPKDDLCKLRERETNLTIGYIRGLCWYIRGNNKVLSVWGSVGDVRDRFGAIKGQWMMMKKRPIGTFEFPVKRRRLEITRIRI
jgi:hypothetical protein